MDTKHHLTTQADSTPAESASVRHSRTLATLRLARGDLEGALAAFQEAVKAAPNEPACRQKVAELLQKLGRTSEALAEYESAAELWAKTGSLLRAMALCKVILQLDPRHLRIPALLANLYTQHEAPRRQAARVGTPPAGLTAPIPFFSSLERDVFIEVLAGFERRVFRPGEVIAREGAAGRSM